VAALGLVLAGCDAPYPPPDCGALDVESGHLCLTRTIGALVPGTDGAAWDAISVETVECAGCAAGSVLGFTAVLDPSGALLVRGLTLGPPIADGSVRYAIETNGLAPDDYQPELFHVLGYGLVYNATSGAKFVQGGPDEFVLTPDGFEARIPASVLPFDGEYWVNAITATPDDPAAPTTFSLSSGDPQMICWDASAATNVCSPLP
jgi:hypothetical protein